VQNADLILLLATGFAGAVMLGYVTHRLGLSPIAGYLLAGVLIGPQTPFFAADTAIAEQLADVGVILLMFGVGLHFNPAELFAVRRVAVPGAVLQSAIATALGAMAAYSLGWPWTAGIVFGLCLSVESTVVLVRVLSDHNTLHTRAGHIAVGWLIVEDVFTVVVLVLLPALFLPSAGGGTLPGALFVTIGKVAVLGLLVFTVGVRLIPWVLTRVALTRSRELFTLAILTIALGIAVISTAAFGVSVALGAFLAGMAVGRSDYSSRAAADALPLRDAFAVLFFVSIGMLFNPAALLGAPRLAAASLLIVLVAKPIVSAIITRASGYPFGITAPVALSRTQIGEFSFILAGTGTALGLLPPIAADIVIAVAFVSIVLNPLLYRAGGPLVRWASRHPGPWRVLNGHRAEDDAGGGESLTSSPHRALVVGYGPTGRTLARLLRENGVTPTVIELSLEKAHEAREHGLRAIYGDAANPIILDQAGVRDADTIVLTSAGMQRGDDAVREAREFNPGIHVIARATYARDVPLLRAAGADRVYSGEAEVALSMTEGMLTRLGATPEQIDRERARVREEIKS